MRSGDRPHEEDDRHDHEPGGDDGGGQADLALADQDPAPGCDEHQEEGPEQLREEPAPFALRVVPFIPGAELERQPVSNALLRFADGIEVVGGRLTGRLGDAGTIPCEEPPLAKPPGAPGRRLGRGRRLDRPGHRLTASPDPRRHQREDQGRDDRCADQAGGRRRGHVPGIDRQRGDRQDQGSSVAE